MKIVNRCAITVEPRQPFIDWAKQLQPDQALPPGGFEPGLYLLSSDIRFWSSGDTKTGPFDGLLMEALRRPLDRCFIGGCRVVVGGGGINAA